MTSTELSAIVNPKPANGLLAPILTDLEARKVAASWYSGGGSALYAFQSTGTIDLARVMEEIDDCLETCQPGEITDLENLGLYILEHGPRKPQEDWAQRLNW